MEKKKYELTKESKQVGDVTLYRIKALKDFADVKKGDLGGWIEKESNLSQEDSCWIYDEARVSGDAMVYENAKVSGKAWISEKAWVSGDAKVSGKTWLSGDAIVFD